MKIAMLVRRMDVNGGVQRHVLAVAREFKKIGHEVTIYTFSYKSHDLFATYGISIEELPNAPKRSSFENIRYIGFFFRYVREHIESKLLAKHIDPNSDFLNPHDHVMYRVSYYFKKRVKNVRSVWVMHDMPTLAFFYDRMEAIGQRVSLISRLLAPFVDFLEKRYIRAQDGICVLNERDQALVLRVYKRRATILRNGVNAEYFSCSRAPQKQDKVFSILMQGIFAPHRRFEDGIEALSLLKRDGYDCSITIIGNPISDEAYARSIQKQVVREGLEGSVTFTGAVSEQKLLHSYCNHDVFLFPNHQQSWGLAVFEAMAAGLPVVVSRSAGASEVLTDGENALLIPPQNPAALAEAIKRLIDQESLREQLSNIGPQFVKKNFSWRQTARTIINLAKG